MWNSVQRSVSAPDGSCARPLVQTALASVLEELVADGTEDGIQVAVWHRDEEVAHAWAGQLSSGQRSVDRNTVFPIFSVIKGVTSCALLLQADRGLVDLDLPIAYYWPDFARNGKERITARHVLTHRAGVPHMPADVTSDWFADWERMTREIAGLKPLHAPGTESFYHGMTFGWIIGELVRRTDTHKRSFEQFVAEELAAPLGATRLFYSIPTDLRTDVATLSGRPYPVDLPAGLPLRVGIPAAIDLQPEVFNRPEVQACIIPAEGGYANADSLVRLFSMLANDGVFEGRRIFSSRRVAEARAERPYAGDADPVLGARAHLSQGGFMLAEGHRAVGSARDTIFSVGAGGSIAWADRSNRLAVAIVHNRMHYGLGERTALRIGNAIRSALGLNE